MTGSPLTPEGLEGRLDRSAGDPVKALRTLPGWGPAMQAVLLVLATGSLIAALLYALTT
ncbi:hypothetical protein ACIPSE_11810 [Streptomyces sp. NPDC090106]|uniref:hypothetical protein n=1 Tax=Streptomyces sp. NPDC090106 TaxID=3365946 RepID=UPI0038176A35